MIWVLPALAFAETVQTNRLLSNMFFRKKPLFLLKFVFGEGTGVVQQDSSLSSEHGVFLSVSSSTEALECGSSGLHNLSEKSISVDSKGSSFYYFHLVDCGEAVLKTNLTLDYQLTVLTADNKHISFHEDFLGHTALLTLLGLALSALAVTRVLPAWRRGEAQDYMLLGVVAGIFLNFCGQFWELAYLFVLDSSGLDITGVKALGVLSKRVSRTIMETLLILLGSGWSITYTYQLELELVLPVLAVVGILQVTLGLVSLIELDEVVKYHPRDDAPGIISTVIELVLLLGFAVTCCVCGQNVKGKSRPFYRFLIVSALAYLSLPLLLHLMTDCYLEESRGWLWMTVSEWAELLCLALWLWLCLDTKSIYAKALFMRGSIFLPDDPKFY